MKNIYVQTRDGPKEIQIPWKFILTVLVLLVLFGILSSSYYTVATNEMGIVQRFGKYNRTSDPGLHFKFPWGIEKVTTVPVAFLYKEEFGFRTLEAGVDTRYRKSREDEMVSLMLTGDLNCGVVEWAVQYTIKDARNYLFKVRNPEITLRDMSESIMREVVGDRSVTEVITKGRQEINEIVETELQKVLDKYESGIQINQVILKDVNPPREVKASFNEVNEAEQERDRLVNEAEKAYEQVIPKARGDAQKMINEAEGYKAERVNRAAGDVARFSKILEEYKKAPEITRQRLYLETLAKILPQIKRKVVIDEEARSVLPFLDLNPAAAGERRVR